MFFVVLEKNECASYHCSAVEFDQLSRCTPGAVKNALVPVMAGFESAVHRTPLERFCANKPLVEMRFTFETTMLTRRLRRNTIAQLPPR